MSPAPPATCNPVAPHVSHHAVSRQAASRQPCPARPHSTRPDAADLRLLGEDGSLLDEDRNLTPGTPETLIVTTPGDRPAAVSVGGCETAIHEIRLL